MRTRAPLTRVRGEGVFGGVKGGAFDRFGCFVGSGSGGCGGAGGGWHWGGAPRPEVAPRNPECAACVRSKKQRMRNQFYVTCWWRRTAPSCCSCQAARRTRGASGWRRCRAARKLA